MIVHKKSADAAPSMYPVITAPSFTTETATVTPASVPEYSVLPVRTSATQASYEPLASSDAVDSNAVAASTSSAPVQTSLPSILEASAPAQSTAALVSNAASAVSVSEPVSIPVLVAPTAPDLDLDGASVASSVTNQPAVAPGSIELPTHLPMEKTVAEMEVEALQQKAKADADAAAIVRTVNTVLIEERRKRAEEDARKAEAEKEKALAALKQLQTEAEEHRKKMEIEAEDRRKKEAEHQKALTDALLKQVAADTAAKIHEQTLNQRVNESESPIAVELEKQRREEEQKRIAAEEEAANLKRERDALQKQFDEMDRDANGAYERLEDVIDNAVAEDGKLKSKAKSKPKKADSPKKETEKPAAAPAKTPPAEPTSSTPLLTDNKEAKTGCPSWLTKRNIGIAVGVTAIGVILGEVIPLLVEHNENNGPTPPPSNTFSYCTSDPYFIRLGFINLLATAASITSFSFDSSVGLTGTPNPNTWCDPNNCAFPYDAKATVTPNGNGVRVNVTTTALNPISAAGNSNVYFNAQPSSQDVPVISNVVVQTPNGFENPAYAGVCPAPKPQSNPSAHTNFFKQRIVKKDPNVRQTVKEYRAAKKADRAANKQLKALQQSQGPRFFDNAAKWFLHQIPSFGTTVDKAVKYFKK